MANKRIKDISTASTSFASDDFVITDSATSGTRKMTKDNLISQVSAGVSGDYLEESNNLSDLASAATSRANLDVNSIAQDAESGGTKLVGPTMRFDGASYVSFADNDAFSFTNGTDDTPFTVTAWVKMEDATNFSIFTKHAASAANREWALITNSADKLILDIRNTSGSYQQLRAAGEVTSYEGQWIHVAGTYGGAGPNSASAFSDAGDEITLYVNGKNVGGAVSSSGTYSGMSNTSQAAWVGRSSSQYAKGEIRDVKLFNKELSAAEVKTLCLSGSMPESFAESTGAISYASDFSAGVDGAAASNGTVVGNIDSIGGQNDNLRYTVDTTLDSHRVTYAATTVDGKRYKVSAEFYVPSTNSDLDGISVRSGSSSANQYAVDNAITQDAWVELSGELVATSTSVRFYAKSGGASTWQDASGTDVFYVRNVRITQIGAVLDARAEQFDTSTGKLYDLSGNDFVGTQSGGVSLLGREFPVYETGTWTPSVAFGGGSTGVTTSIASGFYTRIGNLCHISCNLTLTSKGSDTGTAVITGLPFSSGSISNQNGSIRTVYAVNLAGLTSGIEGRTTDSSTNITLQDWGASGVSVLTNTNWNDNSAIRLAGTYQIQ